MFRQLIVEHECPQCGAPVTLTDSDRILSCRYCRVRLYAFRPQYAAYYLPAGRTAADPLFYVPYWRLHGMRFVVSPSRIEHRLVDTSHFAGSHDGFPPSLGIRTQTLNARFFEFGRVDWHMRPSVGHGEVRGCRDQSQSPPETLEAVCASRGTPTPAGEGGVVAAPPDPRHEQGAGCDRIAHVYVGEVLSMIWAPFYVRNGVLHDGMAGHALRRMVMPDDLLRTGAEDHKPGWKFFAVLCPHCGWELEGEHQTLILRCKNCASAWEAAERGLQSVSFSVQASPTPADMWVPFWELSIDVADAGVHTYADFVRLTGLPRLTTPAMESAPFRFWIPAFRADPGQFLRLARVMTVNQADIQRVERFPDGAYYPVTLPAREGVEASAVVLSAVGALKPRLLELARRGGFVLRSACLVYVPFIRHASAYIQPERKASIPASALRWGMRL